MTYIKKSIQCNSVAPNCGCWFYLSSFSENHVRRLFVDTIPERFRQSSLTVERVVVADSTLSLFHENCTLRIFVDANPGPSRPLTVILLVMLIQPLPFVLKTKFEGFWLIRMPNPLSSSEDDLPRCLSSILLVMLIPLLPVLQSTLEVLP